MFKPIGGTASQHQPGQEIEKCWDGLGGNNFYHSPWAAGATKFPVILEFDFDGTHTLDYFVYTPRSTGGGHWGTFDLYYATQDTPNIFFWVHTISRSQLRRLNLLWIDH